MKGGEWSNWEQSYPTMHKHYPVLFAHSFSCVDWYISWINDASVETQTEEEHVFLLLYLPSVYIKSKLTDLKSNQFSGVKLQNVIMQLISPATLQEDVVASEKLFSIRF